MGETTKPMTWTCLHCGVESPIGESHSGQVGCISALRVRLSAAERERDEAVAWKKLAIAEVVRWAERDVAPMLIGDLQNFVSAKSYDERTRSLHVAAGAVKALEAEVLQTRSAVVRESLAKDAAFARGVEAAALAMALIAETPADAERYAVHIRDTCLALSPATDAGKEPA